jgi:hypothetical protein
MMSMLNPTTTPQTSPTHYIRFASIFLELSTPKNIPSASCFDKLINNDILHLDPFLFNPKIHMNFIRNRNLTYQATNVLHSNIFFQVFAYTLYPSPSTYNKHALNYLASCFHYSFSFLLFTNPFFLTSKK